MEILIQDLP